MDNVNDGTVCDDEKRPKAGVGQVDEEFKGDVDLDWLVEMEIDVGSASLGRCHYRWYNRNQVVHVECFVRMHSGCLCGYKLQRHAGRVSLFT